MPPITQICLDLDEVLCDFVGPALALHGWKFSDAMARWQAGCYSIPLALGMSDADFWEPIRAAGASFCAELPAVYWLKTIVYVCQQVAPVTVVTRSYSPDSAAGKAVWLRRHGFDRYLIGTAKAACAHPGAVLIDDSDAECEAFVDAGGRAICFPRHWNRLHGLKMDPVRFVRDQLEYMTQPQQHERRSACHV